DSLSDINPSLLAAADKNGVYYSSSYFDLLPDSGLRVEALLRVPSRSEFAEYRKKGGKPVETGLVKQVFYIEPSQKAAVIPDDTPVISDIGVFERIASGVSSGIYQPGNLVYEVDEKTLPKAPQFLMLMKAV
ncbi:MAG TPA: hypothetical protein P5511_10300, partial [Candidatus Goldiibacteriota bacterium]|nr:hypothetical protein [Candidatus Goldiibacteriota bacterium]